MTCREPLPRHLRAAITSAGVFLRPGLTQAQRRCALTHEIIHLERGPVPSDPTLAAREERIVEDLTARRLIPLSMLIEALTWATDDDRQALADELWVDDVTLAIRLRNLTVSERARIR